PLAGLASNAVSRFGPVRWADQHGDLIGLLFGGVLAAAIGVIDDHFYLRARWQFLGQMVLALVAIVFGITVDFIANPFGGGILHFEGLVAVGFTVLWVAGMINAINFIDGLDGLSSGIGLIAAITLGVISLTPQVAGG